MLTDDLLLSPIQSKYVALLCPANPFIPRKVREIRKGCRRASIEPWQRSLSGAPLEIQMVLMCSC
jgi:hypothetical protein